MMSAEKISVANNVGLSALKTPKDTEKNISNRVDINQLLARVREEKKKENKVNLVFFSLFVSLILVVGIILSF